MHRVADTLRQMRYEAHDASTHFDAPHLGLQNLKHQKEWPPQAYAYAYNNRARNTSQSLCWATIFYSYCSSSALFSPAVKYNLVEPYYHLNWDIHAHTTPSFSTIQSGPQVQKQRQTLESRKRN